MDNCGNTALSNFYLSVALHFNLRTLTSISGGRCPLAPTWTSEKLKLRKKTPRIFNLLINEKTSKRLAGAGEKGAAEKGDFYRSSAAAVEERRKAHISSLSNTVFRHLAEAVRRSIMI